MFLIFSSLLISVFIIVILNFVTMREKSPIFGVYQQNRKYYWIKFLLVYTFLSLKQFLVRCRRFHSVNNDDDTGQILSSDDVLEQKYDLGNPLAIDAVYFNGVDKDGSIVACNVARRQNNVCDAFLYLKIGNGDLMLFPGLPVTWSKQKESEAGDYKVKGISIENITPMRTWRLIYSGPMEMRTDASKLVQVDFNLTWSAIWVPFNYDFQISAFSMAKDMSHEPWSFEYFELLKKLHQIHYEQMGHIEGTATIGGVKHQIHMPCMRDRLIGPFRDWRVFHRYVHHFIYLENGDCMAVGSVCEPAVLSHLTIGYVCRQSDLSVCAVDYSDFRLYQHGENGTFPRDYGFIFTAGAETYEVQVLVKDEATFFIGEEQEAKLHKFWSTFRVNGLRGWGCVECHYNNVGKKSVKANI